MANQLTKNTKVQLVAGAVADNLDYIRASVSKMDQASFKNKKYGRQYDLYIPGTGNVYEGLEAHPDDLVEHQTPIFLNNFNTSCKLDAFEELGGIDDFTKEIAKPKGTQLARKLQKSVVEKNVYKNMQAVVATTAGFDALSDSAAALAELATDGDLVSFMHPTVMGKIAATGLATFIPAQQAAEIYSKNYLGEYGGASQIRLPVLPVLKTPLSFRLHPSRLPRLRTLTTTFSASKLFPSSPAMASSLASRTRLSVLRLSTRLDWKPTRTWL